MTAWFVTGTDTDAGKTMLGCALLRAAVLRQLEPLGYKPIESGCLDDTIGPDARALGIAGGRAAETSYVFAPPIAPSVAAAQCGEAISLSRIATRVQALRACTGLLLVEGAGGLLAPLSDTETSADLAEAIGLPLLIAAPDRLGTINHTLLTIHEARHRGLKIGAVVLSETRRGAGQGQGNHRSIRAHAEVQVLSLPFCPGPEALADAGEALLTALFADTKS